MFQNATQRLPSRRNKIGSSGKLQELAVEGRPARERVDCVCGATEEDLSKQIDWVQCSNCLAWQHERCVGYDADLSGFVPPRCLDMLIVKEL